MWVIAVLCFGFAVFGALVATNLPVEWLSYIVPVALILIATYFLLQPNIAVDRPRAAFPYLCIPVLFCIGFYDGFFGPGAGSFYMAALLGLGGFAMLEATGRTKLYNFASNAGGFVMYAVIGAVNWEIGLVMAVGQIIGGRVGANLAIANGARLIRPLLVIMTVAMALRLIFQGGGS